MPESVADLAFHSELLSRMREGVFATDAATRISHWNSEAEALLGWTGQQALGRLAGELLEPELPGAPGEPLARLLCATGYEGELRCRRSDGSRHYVDARSIPLLGPAGEPAGAVVSMRDATARRRLAALEEAVHAIGRLALSGLELPLLLQGALEQAVAVLGCDSGAISLREGERWVVRHAVGAAARAVGLEMADDEERHAVLAISAREPVAVNDAASDPRVNREQLARWGVRSVMAVPILLRQQASGVIFLNHERQAVPFGEAEIAFAAKLASTVALAVENARLVERLKLELGQRAAREARIETLAGLYAVLSRVNETIVRVRDEQQLFDEVCRIVAGEGGFPLVWVGLARDGRVAPEAAAGPARGYLAGARVELSGPWGGGPTGTAVREGRTVVNDDFAGNPLAAPWQEAAGRHGLRSSAAFPLRRFGQPIGALTLYASRPRAFDAEHVKLLEALSGDVSFALTALEEERLRREAEHALRASEQLLRDVDRRKNEFLAGLSHELRNPLGPIRTSLYVLDHCDPAGQDASRALAIIGRQVGLMTRLVDDLLDLTRVARGKITLDIGECDLNEVAQRAVEDQRAAFERAGLSLEFVPSPGPLRVRADRQRLAQVIGNLLQNAAKFTPGGGLGRVRVHEEPALQLATLIVEDTGVGMTRETLGAIFEPFMQAEATRDRSRGGLGLGLALVKSLVEQQGGQVSARSDGPGRGSAFEIRLPLAR